MNTEKFSQHFPWPQNINVYLSVPELNNIRIYGKKQKTKTQNLIWSESRKWLISGQENVKSRWVLFSCFQIKKAFETPGLKCLWRLFKTIRPIDMVLCFSPISQCHQPYIYAAAFATGKALDQINGLKVLPLYSQWHSLHTALPEHNTCHTQALQTGEGEPGGTERQEGTCGMTFGSRHQRQWLMWRAALWDA